MKKYTTKRVLAGVLAVMTVAGYAPANVGGLLTSSGFGIVASAAGDTWVSWDEDICDYITSISDGTNSRNATDIQGSINYKFDENALLTIVSKVPLTLTDGTIAAFTNTYDHDNDPATDDIELPANTNLLEKKVDGTYKYEGKYLVTESNGSYTYKVRVKTGLTIKKVATIVTFINTTAAADASPLTLTDGSKVALNVLTGTVTMNGAAAADGVAYQLVKKGTAKIVGEKAFEVYVKDTTNPQADLVKATAAYDSKTGKFIAEAQLPNANAATVYVNKVIPNYTYVISGTSLLASATNAPQVTAASVTAKYEAKVKKPKTEWANPAVPEYKYDTKADLASGGTVPNESRVVLTFTNDVTGEITTGSADTTPVFYKLKITKDGQELTGTAATDPFVVAADGTAYPAGAAGIAYDAALTSSTLNHVPGATSATTASNALAFSATGVYKVEYTVYTRTTNSAGQTTLTPQTLTYNFTIAPKDLLNASNVRLAATGNNLVGTQPINKVGIVNGVVQFEVNDNWKGETITVVPTLFDDADALAANISGASTFNAGGGAANGTPKAITGTNANNELNTVNELTIIYNNANYSSQDQAVTVKWKLVAAKKAIDINFSEANGYTAAQWANRNSGAVPYFTTTIDQLKTFQADLLDSIEIKNGDASKISFEYVEGFGNDANSDELDDHISGLPEKAGKYSVYFIYEGEIVEAVNVQVDEHALFASLTDAQLSYTYGAKKPTTEDLAYVDINGNVIKDAGVKYATIEYKKALKLTAAQCKKITAENKITINATVDGEAVDVTDAPVFTIGSDKYIEGATAAVESVVNYVDAGTYIATVRNDGTAEVAKKGYSLQTKKFAVTVAKKTLSADMITITPKTYTGGTLYPTAGDMTVFDKETNANVVGCTFAGGATSGSEAKTYTIGVQAPANGNYTGKVNATWSIVKVATQEKMNGLEFVAKNTTIFDNGRIHFEVKRPADTQFSNGVAQFGVIYDKTGAIKAPTKNTSGENQGKYPRTGNAPTVTGHTITYTNANGFAAKNEFEDATKKLQLGGGFAVGAQDPTLVEDKTVYGANVNVVGVETGCWFRPYVVDGKGNIYYGEVCYVNLVQEATDALQLKMSTYDPANPMSVVSKAEAKKDQSATVLANKTWRNEVKSGYSEKDGKYYVYGSYTLEGNELVKQSAVQGFGVVVDKKGAFTPLGTLATDDTTTVEDGLKLGKGYIEGKAGSDKMEADEYGALITPSNTVTGVWVRAYVDLGKSKNLNENLIVYTDPVYIGDVSYLYNNMGAVKVNVTANTTAAADDAAAKAVDNKVSFVTATGKQRVNVNSGNIANATLKQSGVIVDKSGSFLLKYTAGSSVGQYVTGDVTANNAALGGHNDTVTAGFTYSNFVAASAKMILGNGYLQGKKTVDAAGGYTVTFSQDKYRVNASAAETNIPAVVRPFSIYEINGKEIVVYGAPIVTQVNG
jgi:hypothetical protein